MSRVHNKKRNVGIIYELLLRSISSFLIEGKTSEAQVVCNILDKRFSSSTELYKEFRLFNALAKSTVSDTSVAAGILSEAKQASRRHNISKLNKEKSFLIKDINHKIKDPEFYHRKIPEYKSYATIQSLINEWRKNDSSNLSKMIEYENKVAQRLLEEKYEEEMNSHVSENVDNLVSKLMMEKLNSKYGEVLNSEQKSIVRTYVFSCSSGESEKIQDLLKESAEKTSRCLSSFSKETDNEVILEKIDAVREKISLISYETVDDSLISKFLTISKLSHEIMESA